MKVLDLDLDYFLKHVYTGIPYSCKERIEEDCDEYVWSKNEVINFLEHNLGLSKERKTPGRIVKNHDEALFFWEELINDKKLLEPFEVIHVDSHADLGLGDASWSFLQSSFLKKSFEERRKIREYECAGEKRGISMGDYLLWAIAYGMISSITYCANPHGEKNDYVVSTLEDFQEEYIYDKPVENYIQLKFNESLDMPDYNSSDEYKKKYLETAIKDERVKLSIIPTIEDVNFDGDFDYVVIAQSPNYTPKSADYIIDLFKEYIEEI